ncbi:phage integrase N-terminal SAM-like domain-containing protein [Saccharospirillum mangrovi]|uniref:phage integrase N-terminal SAM-like domain-containing protein n=1 Tax=Saccharospirillum mangrovi TaxID=2161747 RepID=UPI000D3A5A10|nr:phage integrase N-terminal SAM-like domain-containing protein [Saccharospirillum mangrovi]
MDVRKTLPPINQHRFMDQFRAAIRVRGYSQAGQMQAHHIESFLSHLAVDRFSSVNTQRTALNALVFLFRDFLGQTIGDLNFNRANRPRRLPTVLSRAEANAIILQLTGRHKLVVQLLYGRGLRIMEAMRLHLANQGLFVQDAKGGKARQALLPTSLITALQEQIARVEQLHHADLQSGHGSIYLPNALARKYSNAPTSSRGNTYFQPTTTR